MSAEKNTVVGSTLNARKAPVLAIILGPAQGAGSQVTGTA